ncbi:unannotated protein [freshwater metagenome]|uniref:Unannotated protein n=1 Tax=freshwater metagenome TaxID=449393 RepID=A0A6J7KAQ4_9ZZZZ|nr:hypothetical protein [Actinomycetota bacterium]
MTTHLEQPLVDVEFAALDLETTDFQGEPVEIGVVILGGDGEVRDEWSTLVRPATPVHPHACRVHGLRDDHLVGAPAFDELIGDVDALLSGRIVAGHEVDFDRRTLASAYERHGHARDWPTVCTRRMGFGGALQSEATAIGYVPPDGTWHQALPDARGVAALLATVLREARDEGTETLSQLVRRHPEIASLASVRPTASSGSTPSGRAFTRLHRAGALPDGLDLVARTVGGLPAPVVPGDGSTYAGAVWEALADRLVSADEVRRLVGVAAATGLTEAEVRDVHQACFRRAAAAAAADHVITTPEQRDLTCVAGLLQISPADAEAVLREEIDAAIGHATALPAADAVLPEGTRVVVTGEVPYTTNGRPITRADMAALMTSAGLVPKKAVSRMVDLVVVCDPNSGSRKAEEARIRGIRVMVVEEFLEALGVVTD